MFSYFHCPRSTGSTQIQLNNEYNTEVLYVDKKYEKCIGAMVI